MSEEINELQRRLRRQEINTFELKREILVLRGSDEKVKRTLDKQEKLEEDLSKQGEDLKEQKQNFIQYFGLFATLFAIISFDIQLMKSIENVWQMAGMILIVNTSPVLFFGFIYFFMCKGKEFKHWAFGSFITLAIVFMLGGLLVLKYGTSIKNFHTINFEVQNVTASPVNISLP